MHNLLHWRLLVAVADSGTITQAAALCGMTQSAASRAIAQLETMLSTRLLVRQPHNVVLTQSGLQIVTHARTMLEALRAIQQCAQQAGNAHAGKIRRPVSRRHSVSCCRRCCANFAVCTPTLS